MYSTTTPLNFEVSSGQLFVADPAYVEPTVWIDFMFFSRNPEYEVEEPWESAEPQADQDAPKKPFGFKGGKFF